MEHSYTEEKTERVTNRMVTIDEIFAKSEIGSTEETQMLVNMLRINTYSRFPEGTIPIDYVTHVKSELAFLQG